MTDSNRYLHPLVSVTLAAAVAVPTVAFHPVRHWLPVFVLMALTFTSENFAFELPVNGSVSLSFAMIYAALLIGGPTAGMVCALAASMTLREIRSGVPLGALVFNSGQLALSAALAGLAYIGVGGRVLMSEAPMARFNLPAALTAALVFYVVNVSFVTSYVATRTGQPPAEVLRAQGFLSYAASLVVLALLGLMIAVLLVMESWVGLVLLTLPFMAARRTFRVYVELRDAYTSTVRSLVAAIEAKDPYTRGHSERVAVYARSLAEELGLARQDLERVERAALLHDVGKIGIDTETLTSSAQLAPEEVLAIRLHPVLGGELVADVEFLADIVGVVRHHHERYDGAGYPDGLSGEGIPALARILAVADCYDAMTSDRAYRPGMSQNHALEEIGRVAGTQLDEAYAMRFIDILQSTAKES